MAKKIDVYIQVVGVDGGGSMRLTEADLNLIHAGLGRFVNHDRASFIKEVDRLSFLGEQLVALVYAIKNGRSP